MKVVVGISGASGVIYGIRALQSLRTMDEIEAHLVLTDGARTNIAVESICSASATACTGAGARAGTVDAGGQRDRDESETRSWTTTCC